MMLIVTIAIVAYLLGSIPSGVWVGRMVRGIDIRAFGSGSIGATNAARLLGLPWGMLVGVIDVAKGFVPVVWLGPVAAAPGTLGTAEARLLLGTAAIVGHLFPIWAGFRGGKGVLTGLGVFVALLPVEVAVAAAVWLVVFALTRIVSAGSLAAAAALAATVIIRRFALGAPISNSLVVASVLVALLVFITHRSNIRRLLAGTESRFAGK